MTPQPHNNEQGNYQYSIDALKNSDRYTQLLFLPENIRGPAASIFAFQQEIDRIPYLVSEPMPGEIRLQWWREVLLGQREGEAHANPLANDLLIAIRRFNLPKDGFIRFIDAKVFDLYNDPMPDRETLEAYLGETESFIFQMIITIMGEKNTSLIADACGHSGVALGIANLIQQLPYHLDKQQSYVPSSLIDACGIDGAAWFSAETQNHISAYHGFAALGQEHLTKAKNVIAQLPKESRVCFLSLSANQLVFTQAKKRKKNLRQPLKISPLAKQWAMWKTILLGL